MNLGVSLPYDYLCGADASPAAAALRATFGPAEAALQVLRHHGVRTVEVRHFLTDTPAEMVVRAAQRVWQAGCVVTLHPATPPRCEVNGLSGVFPWLPEIADQLLRYQSELMLTIHACSCVAGDLVRLRKQTETMFKHLAQMADADRIPARFALELNRFKGEGDPSTSYRSVAEMYARIGQERVGICWDWGHTQANVAEGIMEAEPPPEFVRGVIHTHIHDLGPSGETHWPLSCGRVPLKENVRTLRRAEYRGVYCLELSPERFHPQVRADRALLESIRLVSEAMAGEGI
jgi:sugar phosphate isomerase/epimerase